MAKSSSSPNKKPLSFWQRLDPFTYCDLLLARFFPVPAGKKPSFFQEMVYQGAYLLTALLTALAIFLVLSLVLQTPSPIVIVVSESMEPHLFRGDAVILQGVSFADLKADLITVAYPLGGALFAQVGSVDYQAGTIHLFGSADVAQLSLDNDIVVYDSPFLGRQIIHRAQAKIQATDGEFLITKGDNALTNPKLDQDCQTISTGDGNASRVALQCVNPTFPRTSQIAGKALFRIPLVGCVKLWVFDDLPSLLLKGRLPESFRGVC